MSRLVEFYKSLSYFITEIFLSKMRLILISSIKRLFFLKKLFLLSVKSPARISVYGFISVIFIGTLLLMLPISSKQNSLGFIDALFTATSASCVTGLSVIDVANTLTLFGQIVLLLLIQVGGLGIMTISTLLIMIAGGRANMAEKNIIKDTFSYTGLKPFEILKSVVLLTVFFEISGAIILFFRFIFMMPFSEALYKAVFHSISAFCNAGFSLFNGSLSQFVNDPIVSLTVSALIIAGGLGFLVVFELKDNFPSKKKRWEKLSIHTKLVLITSIVLILSGTILIMAFEWNNTLKELSFGGKVLASIFQSITFRTAGFNTIPIGDLTNQILFVGMIFMVIGASPGSCGGGIKTTTLATLFLLGYNRIKGNMSTSFAYRKIPDESVTKAVNILIISTFIIMTGFILILMTELKGNPSESRGMFIELMFEVTSAFGTTGLSMGITDSLSNMGRLIITILMFIGRLGPLMIGIAISRGLSAKYEYAEENVMIG